MNPLRQKIEQEIRDRGPIPFSRYMELCLYDPELGYYSRNAEQFGKAGDFYTSSDVHAVFGRLLARQFDEMWRALGSPEKIEPQSNSAPAGACSRKMFSTGPKKVSRLLPRTALHPGRKLASLCASESKRRWRVTSNPEARNSRPNGSRSIAERTAKGTTSVFEPALSERSDRRVPKSGAHTWALAPEVPLIVFANEFFDALPVEIISPLGSLHIDTREGRFVETWAPSSPEELEFLDRYSIHPEPDERVEIPLIAQQYMHGTASTHPSRIPHRHRLRLHPRRTTRRTPSRNA